MADQPETVAAGAESTPRRKRTIAALLVVGTLAVAVVGAILTSGGGQLNIWFEQFVGQTGTRVGGVGDLLPLGFAFGAGLVAAFNPCGFPMLPTYLALFMSEDAGDGRARTTARLVRSLAVGATVTLAVVLVIGVIGFTIAAGANAVVGAIPWVALGLGVVLVAVGGYQVAGGSLYSAVPERLGARVGASGRGRGVSGYFLFGLAYGLASLSCTLPIFLVVLGVSVTGTSLVGSLGAVLLYGLGMGSVIMILTIAIGLLRTAISARLRGIVRYVDKIGTIALFVAGGYIVYFWLTFGRVVLL